MITKTEQELLNNWRAFARTECFQNHAATLRVYSKTHFTLDWRNKNESNVNGVRYIFDGSTMIFTGDLGSGIFNHRKATMDGVEWLANPDNIYQNIKRMECFSEEMFEKDEDVFHAELADNFNKSEASDEEEKEQIDKEYEAVIDIWYSEGEDNFKHAILSGELDNVDDELDFDCSRLTHISELGDVPNEKIIWVLEGLKMAIEQVSVKQKSEGDV